MKMTTSFEQDKCIIAQLRKDARASLTSISKSTGITISTLFERLKQLRGQAITKFTCIVDFKRLGLHAHSLAVYSVSRANKKALQKYLRVHPNVNSVYRINHKYDFLVELVFDGLLAQEEFIDKTDELFGTRHHHIFYLVDILSREKVLSAHSTSSIAKELKEQSNNKIRTQHRRNRAGKQLNRVCLSP